MAASGLSLHYQSAVWNDSEWDLSAPLYHSKELLHLPPDTLALFSDAWLAEYSFHEACHFFAVNIAGEDFGITTMRETPEDFWRHHDLLEYRERLLAEEQNHTDAFSSLLRVAKVNAGSMKLFGSPKRISTLSGLLEFFANIYLFEHVTTAMSLAVMRDDRVEAKIRSLHRFHWQDERHHLRLTKSLMRSISKMTGPEEATRVLKKCEAWANILKRSLFPGAWIETFGAKIGQNLLAHSLAPTESFPTENFIANAVSSLRETLS